MSHRASPHMRDRARELRKSPTLSEQRLWNWLRNRTFSGFKFLRQVAVDRYVLDFHCPRLKLAIEVDGRQHELDGVRECDDERTTRLHALGIAVLRIPNKLLAQDSLLVQEQILFAIETRLVEVHRW